MNLRFEEPADWLGIHLVHAACFPSPAEAELVDALRAAGQLTLSLVALDGEQIVGHVGFSPVQLEGAPNGLGLAPVAVLESHRKRGIADGLIREGLLQCERAGRKFIVVLGDPAYYSRFGFAAASQWSLADEYGGGDAFQAIELCPQSLPSGGGLIRYAAQFANL